MRWAGRVMSHTSVHYSVDDSWNDCRLNMVDNDDESDSLRVILQMSSLEPKEFFQSVWQNSCRVFKRRPTEGTASVSNKSAFERLIDNGWDEMLRLLQAARHREELSSQTEWRKDRPILFQNQETLSHNEQDELFGSSPSLFAAYLHGCSVVINHADWHNLAIADLCEDLQRSFPHVFANTYLTPPDAQAVPAHADDRDVLIVQVVGRKVWKVYSHVPIPHPYSHEQVGKGGREVPSEVFKYPAVIDCILEPGDVLYLPRGFVHEAKTPSNGSPMPSFHVTIALATHDWTVAGLLMSAGESLWLKQADLRRAMPREVGSTSRLLDEKGAKALQSQLETAIEKLRQSVTMESVQEAMRIKYSSHIARARQERQKHLRMNTSCAGMSSESVVVGPRAADLVSLSSRIRVATLEEKESVKKRAKTPLGLHVRESSFNVIMSLLQKIRSKSEQSFTVGQLRALLDPTANTQTVCDLTILSFARTCVELGAIALLSEQS